MSPDPLARVWLGILALLICYQTYYSLETQKSPGWDAAMGFLTLQSSLEHGDFNRLHHPSPANLAEDRAQFIAWWTPGQYLIPHWVARAFDTDLGTALRLVTVFCNLAALAGYHLLYARLGFSRRCIWLCLIVVCSQHYWLKSSRVYSGGDLLLFSAAPYVALAVLTGQTRVLGRAWLAAVACFFALFLKASALTLLLALVLGLALEILGWPDRRSLPPAGRSSGRRQLLILGGILVLYAVATELAYLSKGVTIGASARPLDTFTPDRWWGVAIALAGPLYGAFSFLEPYHTRIFFIPVALLSLLAMGKLGLGFKTEGLADYRRMLVAHGLVFFGFFAGAYLVGMGISHEPRHFRIAGLLLLPGLVHLALAGRHQTAAAGAMVVLSLASVALYHREHNTGPVPADSASRWGIRQPVSNASLEAMHRLDDTGVTKDTIVYNGFGACPALLLEFNHGRKLQDDNFLYFGVNYYGRTSLPWPLYRQSCESIVFLIPKNNRWYFGPALEEVAQTFERPLQVVRRFENDELIIYQGSVR